MAVGRLGRAVAVALVLATAPGMAPVRAQGEATPAPEPGSVPAPVTDQVAPVIAPMAELMLAAEDGTGAVLTYTLPDARDETDGPVAVSCDPAPGTRVPVGVTWIHCRAVDAAGNEADVQVAVTVADTMPPTMDPVPDLLVQASDPAGTTVSFEPPAVWDNVDGDVVAACDWPSGAHFPPGTTVVTCSAQDASGNVAVPATFRVDVLLAPSPTPVETPPDASLPATPAPTAPPPTDPAPVAPSPTPAETPVASPTAAPRGAQTATATPTGMATSTGTPTPSPSPRDASDVPVAEEAPRPPATTAPSPDPLNLPWPPPGAFQIVTDGGPLNGLDAIWGYRKFPISQEFGHTEFSIAHFAWYRYGLDYGLDGYEHPGLDVAMPAGTWLYSPVEGVVTVSGNSPYYTFYGNGGPNVGELRIETAAGHEVILGHMGRIAVDVGDHVEVGQFVGLSGGENGDHLHLEVRERQWWGWWKIVDPRRSFVVDVLRQAALDQDGLDGGGAQTGATPGT